MITVICPVYNEAKFIKNLIEFFVKAEPRDKELIIIDGGSSDGTDKIIREYENKFNNIKLLVNKKKYVPYALNIAVKYSSGDPIVRLDAHTEYSSDYFLSILKTFKETNADIVGGPMRKLGKTDFQKSVAYCTSSLFGIGDSKIHREDYFGESDHVYLGAWRRNLFEKIGFFDENLHRNQDDEFHYRAKSLGLKIILNPDIKSYYLPRESLFKLVKQYFQYGYYKPLVLMKVKSEIKLRHLIPSIFVVLFTLLLITRNLFLFIPFVIYLMLDFYFSLRNNLTIIQKIESFIIFPAIHLSYGTGFLIGLFNWIFDNYKLKIQRK